MADQDETVSKSDKLKENSKLIDSVPELDDTEPPKVIISNPPTMSIKITSNKLQKSEENKDLEDCQIIIPKTEIIDITDDTGDKETCDEVKKVFSEHDIQEELLIVTPKEESKEPETEVISEDDEMAVNTMPVDTEAVSEDELPPTTLADQTESVSDDELPSENGTGKTKRCSKVLDEQTKEDENELQPEKKLKTEEVKPLTEFDKFWQAVKDDPSDFADGLTCYNMLTKKTMFKMQEKHIINS